MTKVKNINVAIDTGTLKLMLDKIGKLEARVIELETKLACVQSQTTVNNYSVTQVSKLTEMFPELLAHGLPGETEWVR